MYDEVIAIQKADSRDHNKKGVLLFSYLSQLKTVEQHNVMRLLPYNEHTIMLS